MSEIPLSDDDGEMEDETLVSFFHECYVYALQYYCDVALPSVVNVASFFHSIYFFPSSIQSTTTTTTTAAGLSICSSVE